MRRIASAETIVGLFAVLFGAATVLAGAAALFAGETVQESVGNAVPFVLWFNFLAGFAYIAGGIGLAARYRWSAALAVAIAIATLLVFAGFGAHVATGGAYEPHTAAAMTFRSFAWLAIAAYALRASSSWRTAAS